MDNLFGGDIHYGLSGIDLDQPTFDLGEGISLSRAYALIFAPMMMAFTPAPPGKHSPGPWKAVSGGLNFRIGADLLIPSGTAAGFESKTRIAKAIAFLLRVGVNPAVVLPIVSDRAFAERPDVQAKEATMMPLEIRPRRFPLSIECGNATVESMAWVRERWRTTHDLMRTRREFALAVDAIDQGQFVENTALTLVSLWAALEALFSPAKTELRFRVSCLIAAFLEVPGECRANLQRDVAKLYDVRSSAAHGNPDHSDDDLLSTFNLLRSVLLQIIDRGSVPSKAELEAALFGVSVRERT